MRLGDVRRDTLRESETRYRRLFETACDGILLLNADSGQIEDVNPYLIDMLGYSHAEFLGKKLWEVGTFADIPQSKEMFLKLQTEGYVRYEDLPLKTKAGVKIQVEFHRPPQNIIRTITQIKICSVNRPTNAPHWQVKS